LGGLSSTRLARAPTLKAPKILFLRGGYAKILGNSCIGGLYPIMIMSHWWQSPFGRETACLARSVLSTLFLLHPLIGYPPHLCSATLLFPASTKRGGSVGD
jgi:hypothetical protein